MLLPLVLLGVTGCFADNGPRFSDDVKLSERWRMPSPVPTGADGRWHLNDDGLLGEGNRLARIDTATGRLMWSEFLSPEYAITDAHPAIRAGGQVVLRAGRTIRALGIRDGKQSWERLMPDTAQIVYDNDLDTPRLLTANCGRTGCDLAALDPADGKPIWTRRLADQVALRAGTPYCQCAFLIGTREITWLSTVNGTSGWAIARPPGAEPLLFPFGPRLIMLIPPTLPDCRATFVGTAIGVVTWNRTLTWNDLARPDMPCSYDPERVFFSEITVEAPGAGIVDTLGVVTADAFDPGEYLVGDDPARLTWTPGVGYRSRTYPDRGVAEVPAPDDGQAWGTRVEGLWLLRSGPGLVLYNPFEHDIRWRSAAPTPIVDEERGETRVMAYVDGTDLVAIGPPRS